MNYLMLQIGKTGSEMCEQSKSNKIKNCYRNENISLLINRENNRNGILEKDGLIIGLIGEIIEEQAQNELDKIYEVYSKHGELALHSFNGLYTIVIVDYHKEKIYVIQDRHTSLEHIYFYQDKQTIYISNMIKEIFNSSNMERKVNVKMLPTYLHYSYTPGKETLIQDIFKIPSNHVLGCDLKQYELTLSEIKEKQVEREPDSRELIQIIDDSIKRRIDKSKKIGILLSGGFDSNFLLSRVVKMLDGEEINVFTFGYDSPKSEIKNTERIVELYKSKGINLKHHKYYIESQAIHKLPKILDFLQEPIFEPGLINHFGLAEVLEKQGVEHLLGGDCNDQVYEGRLYLDMVSKMQETIDMRDYPVYGRLRLGEFDRIHSYKYFTDIETQWLLNPEIEVEELKILLEVYSEIYKNYFMMKRFLVRKYDVEVKLPFLDEEYVNYINKELKLEDLPFKKYHLELCKKNIPTDIYNELINATEATSPYSYTYLGDDKVRKEIFNLVLLSNTTKTYFNIDSVKTLLDNFENALRSGYEKNDFYKASVLSCRIFTLLGFLVWHNVYINGKNADADLYEVLGN